MTEPKKINIYSMLVVLLLGGFILFLVWSGFQAAGLGSRVTDTDYYSKGLKYNTTMVEKRAAEVLGWNIEARLDERVLRFSVRDQEGRMVSRAAGSLYLAVPGSAENIHLPVKEVDPGSYQVSLGSSLNGTIQARLELEREGARLSRQLLLNL